MSDVPSSWSPLELSTVEAAVAAAAGPDWTVRLLPAAGSTNEVAAADPVPRSVVVADHQTAGRGRLDRSWSTPPGTALTFSLVLRPALPDPQWSLLPLAVALGASDAIASLTGVRPELKWPNDLLIGGRKLSGILLERVPGRDDAGPVVIAGIGINVGMRAEQLPVEGATSLAVEGVAVDRADLLGALVAGVDARVAELAADRSAVLAAYRETCVTLGRQVRVHLPTGGELTGLAQDVDDDGRLVVDGVPVGAGDVVHVRPVSSWTDAPEPPAVT